MHNVYIYNIYHFNVTAVYNENLSQLNKIIPIIYFEHFEVHQ